MIDAFDCRDALSRKRDQVELIMSGRIEGSPEWCELRGELKGLRTALTDLDYFIASGQRRAAIIGMEAVRRELSDILEGKDAT
jgi:hypothetical protein